MLTPAQWASYRDKVNETNNSFNQEEVIWRRTISNLDRYGEDNKETVDITILALLQYNIFRSWPMTSESTSGALDKESMVMILNIDYLSKNGYLTINGNLDFDPSSDIFIHNSQEYRAAGETPMSQAGDRPLFIQIILKRLKTPTGTNKY